MILDASFCILNRADHSPKPRDLGTISTGKPEYDMKDVSQLEHGIPLMHRGLIIQNVHAMSLAL